mmetsp:Transcript_28974/g.67886  ORF Transcript_28974/g.67886 Transcript_28974/m.67886 type:complete len:146 (-) Transcript_28974:317-754(-)
MPADAVAEAATPAAALDGEANAPRAPRPRLDLATAATAAREKLDLLIARPCREDCVEAIAVCVRAAAFGSRAPLGAAGRKEQPPPPAKRANAPKRPRQAEDALTNSLMSAVAEMGQQRPLAATDNPSVSVPSVQAKSRLSLAGSR